MLAKSQFLFVIGVEKCGTTSLFRAMQSLPQFNLTKRKEAGFFRTQYEKGITHFESLFSESFQGTAYNTDITPLYHRFPKVMRRIERFDAKKKILIMLRHPIRRAFSHYTHDIINHAATGERSDHFRQALTFSFFDLWDKEAAYFLRYEPIIADAYSRFGEDNCHVLFFEDMVKDWHAEATRLDAFFGFPEPVLASVDLPHENRIQNVPVLFTYGKEGHDERWLAQKTSRGVTFLDGLSSVQVGNAFLLQGSFTLFVPKSVVAEMIEWFDADWQSLEELLGVDLGAWRQTFEMSHTFAPVENADLEAARERLGRDLGRASYAGFGLRKL